MSFISSLIYLDCILILGCLHITAAAVDSANQSPRDYAHATINSRVSHLVNFFEVLDRTSKGIDLPKESHVVLSLAESANKLCLLLHGKPLASKCNLYVKLLSRPNIRSVVTISELMREQPSFDEIKQADANLVANLVSERSFDALAHIQTIVQALDSESTRGRLNLEANVHKELLDCINYYTYRHQRALTGVARYARESMERLSPSMIKSSSTAVLASKFDKSIEKIKSIELEQNFNYFSWLHELAELQGLALENDYEVPHLVVEFLAEQRRVARLNALFESEQLKSKLLMAESQANEPSRDTVYLEMLSRLQELCSSADFDLPLETCHLLAEEPRARLIKQQAVDRSDKPADPSVRSAAVVGVADAARPFDHIGETQNVIANVPLSDDSDLFAANNHVDTMSRSELAQTAEHEVLDTREQATGSSGWPRWLKMPAIRLKGRTKYWWA